VLLNAKKSAGLNGLALFLVRVLFLSRRRSGGEAVGVGCGGFCVAGAERLDQMLGFEAPMDIEALAGCGGGERGKGSKAPIQKHRLDPAG